jgi:hypothetical protein
MPVPAAHVPAAVRVRFVTGTASPGREAGRQAETDAVASGGGWRPRQRAGLVAAVMVAGLGLVACGGGSSGPGVASGASTTMSQPASVAPNSSGSSSRQALVFSRCMRQNGVPDYPDPDSSGQIPKRTPPQLGVSPSRLQAAETACQHLLPGGGQLTQAQIQQRDQQEWARFRDFTRCMRSHGVTDWPGPTPYPQNQARPIFDLQPGDGPQPVGIDPNSPQISPKVRACVGVLQGDNPQHLGQGGS